MNVCKIIGLLVAAVGLWLIVTAAASVVKRVDNSVSSKLSAAF